MLPPPRSLFAPALAALLLPSAFAQVLIPTSGSLPACAAHCALLQSAQTGCVPPAAPQSSQTIYQSCFCQSALLTPLKSGGTNICPAQCDSTDYAAIVSWYNGLCGSGKVVTNSVSSTSSIASTSTLATTTTSSGGAAATTANNGGGADDNPDNVSGPVWWSTHWNWVVMVIVLFVAFLLIGVLGTIFYRRHKRKRDYGDTVPVPRDQMASWGPNQGTIHDLGGQTAANGAAATRPTRPAPAETGKGKEKVTLNRVSSRRLKKGASG